MQLATLNNQPTMTTREIAELTGKEHSHVMRDAKIMLEQIGKDVPSFGDIYQDTYGREQPCLKLDKDLTITLVAGYSTPIRHKIVKRWRELEEQQVFQVPQTRAGLLRLALEQEEKIEAQTLQLEAQRPAVEFVEKYTQAAHGSMGFRQVCKQLKANEARFRDFLFDNDIMYRLNGDLTAYQNHINAGRFEITTDTFNGKNRNICHFTAKGVVWIAQEWNKSQEV